MPTSTNDGMINKNNKSITILECLRMDSNMVDLSVTKNKRRTFVRLCSVVVGPDGLEPPTYSV